MGCYLHVENRARPYASNYRNRGFCLGRWYCPRARMVQGWAWYAIICHENNLNAELAHFIQGMVLEGMRLICTLNANLSALAGGLQIRNGPHGTKFYQVDYHVCVYFGGTQLRAKLQWYQKVSTWACHDEFFLTGLITVGTPWKQSQSDSLCVIK